MTVLAGVAGFLGTRLPAPKGTRWERTSFDGSPVSLRGGVQVASGVLLASLLARRDVRAAALVAGSAGAVAGYIDDHHEDMESRAKGLRGHLAALREGRLTTGAMKIGIIGAGSLIAAGLLARADQTHRSGTRRVGDLVVRSAAIAGTANLINLLDLRPGRALKASSLIGALLAPGSAGAGPLLAGTAGAVAGTLPGDLAGDTMLGDLGANTLGGVLGTALAAHPQTPVRFIGAVAATGLILASERVSFSAVIDSNRVLSAIDRWGR